MIINLKSEIPKMLAESRIISEDIENLAKTLIDCKDYFSGKTFLITGAGGFLGKYMVLLLKHINDHVLEQKLRAILLDNFIVGYEQIHQDEYLVFKKQNV